MIYGIVGFVVLGVLAWALVATPKTPEERYLEDLEQMEWIEKNCPPKQKKKK